MMRHAADADADAMIDHAEEVNTTTVEQDEETQANGFEDVEEIDATTPESALPYAEEMAVILANTEDALEPIERVPVLPRAGADNNYLIWICISMVIPLIPTSSLHVLFFAYVYPVLRHGRLELSHRWMLLFFVQAHDIDAGRLEEVHASPEVTLPGFEETSIVLANMNYPRLDILLEGNGSIMEHFPTLVRFVRVSPLYFLVAKQVPNHGRGQLSIHWIRRQAITASVDIFPQASFVVVLTRPSNDVAFVTEESEVSHGNRRGTSVTFTDIDDVSPIPNIIERAPVYPVFRLGIMDLNHSWMPLIVITRSRRTAVTFLGAFPQPSTALVPVCTSPNVANEEDILGASITSLDSIESLPSMDIDPALANECTVPATEDSGVEGRVHRFNRRHGRD